MNIFFDHQAFSLQDYGGITRIFTELVKGLEQKGHTGHLSLLYSNNAYLKENAIIPNKLFNKFGHIKRRRILYAINELYNIYDIRKSSFDIYHPTYYGYDLIKYAKNKPIVVTFHDLTNEKLAGTFEELRLDKKLLDQKKTIIEKATCIIAVSENTKKDIIEYYQVDPSKIKVVYLGNSFNADSGNEQAKNSKAYILYVGNRGLYKNFIPFLKSISSLLIENDIQLVCAGGKAFTEEERKIIDQFHVKEYLKQIPVNDTNLAVLYKNALAFVFPSLYEGFGIPILEAFACNCPCILSNTSSLPEVARDAAIYMDPYDPKSMHDAVMSIVANTSIRNELTIKGSVRLKSFSWEKHVSEMIEIYSELSK